MIIPSQHSPITTPIQPGRRFTLHRRGLWIAGCGLTLATLAACGSSAASTKNATSAALTSASASVAATTGSAAAPSSTQSSQAAVVITISNFAYTTPASVAPGAVITVVNKDSENHTVTADSGNAFDDKATASSSTTFTAPMTPGSYPFHCIYHANMHGVLVVR